LKAFYYAILTKTN